MSLRGVAGGLLALHRLLGALARRVPLHDAHRDFYGMLYGLASRRVQFINKGFAPLDPTMPRLPALADEPFQAAECFEALRAGEAALGRAPARVVEAACGRGGALLLAAAMWPQARLAGFDLQREAMRAAASLLAVEGQGRTALAVAHGSHMPIADGWADLLLSIEGMMSHDRIAFMAEAQRVLAPGGALSVVSTMNRPLEEARLGLLSTSLEHGLEMVDFRDIAPAVLEACRLDGARRLGVLRFVPGPLGRVLTDAATLPGSPTYEELASGHRCFYLAVMVRRG